MNREEMIEQLVIHELEWLHDNFDKHSLTEVAEFFTRGGFHAWTDEQIAVRFNDLFSEENK